MKLRIRDRKDFNAGLAFVAIGAFFAAVATNYPMGSALRMGPGYFPAILGGLLVVLGFAVLARAFIVDGAPPPPVRWRPLAWITGSIAGFALLVGPLQAGLVPSAVALVVACARGGWEFRWREAVPLALALTAFTVLVFHYGLGLPFRLWPWS
jgi:hypothetical protein